jgi:cell division protein FtsN
MWKLGLAAMCIALQISTAGALEQRNMPLPAEFPPITYKGAQYVDSKGCVFIRAGSFADVAWVPRLTRQRKQVCNRRPTRISAKDLEVAEPSEVMKITLDGLKPVTADPAQAKPTETTQSNSFYWTQTEPYRLIDRLTQRDVTAIVALIYPYTDFATQKAELGMVSIVRKEGQTYKHLVRNSPVVQPLVQKASPTSRATDRFVQVAAYVSSKNAQRTAALLSSEGLSVKFSTIRQGRQDVQLVLTGPFRTKEAASQTLRHVVQMGFADAYIRKR